MPLIIFFSNSQSQEPGFFLMFERNVYIPTFANLLEPKLRYMGNKSKLHSLEMLKEAYTLVAVNFKKARDWQPNKVTKEISKFKVGDLVLLRSHM